MASFSLAALSATNPGASLRTEGSASRPASSSLSSSSLKRRHSRICAAAAPNWPTPDLDAKISKGIKEAEATCAEPNHTGECAVAWDVVEELFAARADLIYKQRFFAPSARLKAFCAENPGHAACSAHRK